MAQSRVDFALAGMAARNACDSKLKQVDGCRVLKRSAIERPHLVIDAQLVVLAQELVVRASPSAIHKTQEAIADDGNSDCVSEAPSGDGHSNSHFASDSASDNWLNFADHSSTMAGSSLIPSCVVLHPSFYLSVLSRFYCYVRQSVPSIFAFFYPWFC